MKNYRFVIRDRLRARAKFALAAAGWATLALLGIVLLTAYTIRLDIAFMEANHMIRDEGLRNAIFVQVFDLDSWVYFAYPLGIIGNAVIAAIFARSQDRYFTHLREAFENFSKSWMRPDLRDLGPLTKFCGDFMVLVQGSFVDGKSSSYLEVRTRKLNEWPKEPLLYWRDLFKYGLLSGILSLYFSSLCMIVFWQANGKILDLARALTSPNAGDAPQFFTTQMAMSETIGWSIAGLITCASIWTGVHFASTTSNAAYACGRQLRLFLEGNSRARIFLRFGDPGREDIGAINEVLDKLEKEQQAKAQA